MGMNSADILACCIKESLGDLRSEEDYLKAAGWVDKLRELADPQADRLRTMERVLQKVLDDSDIGVVPRSHLDTIETLLNT